MTKLPRHLSPSSLDTYARCPAAWHARYVLGQAEPPSLPMRFGSAIHAGLEAAYKGQDGGVVFLREWRGHTTELVTAGVAVDPGLTARGLALIDQALGLGLVGEPERRCTLRADGLPPIIGIADLWDQTGGHVVDYKVPVRPWTARKAAAQRWQPAIYSAALSGQTFEFVVLPASGGHLQRFAVTVTPELIATTLDAARATWASIQAGAFACTCGQHGEPTPPPETPAPNGRCACGRALLAWEPTPAGTCATCTNTERMADDQPPLVAEPAGETWTWDEWTETSLEDAA